MTNSNEAKNAKAPSVMVIQSGGRRGYVVPRMLEASGILHSLHTSFALPEKQSYLMKIAKHFLASRKAALERRTIYGVPKEKVYSHWLPDIARQLVSFGTTGNMRSRRAAATVLGHSIRRAAINKANLVLSINGDGGPALLNQLKQLGLPLAVDIAITPMALESVYEALPSIGAWSNYRLSEYERSSFKQWYEEVVSIADLVIYPSDGVLDGLKRLDTFNIAKSRCVPYAMGTIVPLAPAPEQGRILFVGNNAIRKGLPYFARAARLLRQRGRNYTFLVAGEVPATIKGCEEASELTFIGHISRQSLAKELARADIFCLPSLAEGTAAAALEALASRVPCVVTRAAGTPVVEGFNGLIVPPCTPSAIAEAIDRIVSDRNFRDLLSHNAYISSKDFDKDQVSSELHAAMQTLLLKDYS